MTRAERGVLVQRGGVLLELATLHRNAAAVLTEHTLIPLAEELAAALRIWADQLDDTSAALSRLVLETRRGQ